MVTITSNYYNSITTWSTSSDWTSSVDSTVDWNPSMGPTATYTYTYRNPIYTHFEYVSAAESKIRRRIQEIYNMLKLKDELFEL